MRCLFLALSVGIAHAALLAVAPALCGGVAALAASPANGLLLALLALAAGAEALAVAGRTEAAPAPPLCRLSALALLSGFWIALCEGALDGASSLGAPAALGGAVLLAGGVLRVQAIRALGDRFVSDHRAAPLVTQGLYGVLRHPSETGQLLLAAGAALFVASAWAMLWTVVVILPLTWLRLRREEQVLLQEVPVYAAYRTRVDGLVPFRCLARTVGWCFVFPGAGRQRKGLR